MRTGEHILTITRAVDWQHPDRPVRYGGKCADPCEWICLRVHRNAKDVRELHRAHFDAANAAEQATKGE